MTLGEKQSETLRNIRDLEKTGHGWPCDRPCSQKS